MVQKTLQTWFLMAMTTLLSDVALLEVVGLEGAHSLLLHLLQMLAVK